MEPSEDRAEDPEVRRNHDERMRSRYEAVSARNLVSRGLDCALTPCLLATKRGRREGAEICIQDAEASTVVNC